MFRDSEMTPNAKSLGLEYEAPNHLPTHFPSRPNSFKIVPLLFVAHKIGSIVPRQASPQACVCQMCASSAKLGQIRQRSAGTRIVARH
jgi:hypothetical protein